MCMYCTEYALYCYSSLISLYYVVRSPEYGARPKLCKGGDRVRSGRPVKKRLRAKSTSIGSANRDSGWLNGPPLFPPL